MLDLGLAFQQQGLKLGLVPTMGYLHEGHLSLLKLLEGKCDIKAASIFVNPLQFGPGEDFERYPRDEAQDLKLLDSAGCDLVFIPSVKDMYPIGFQTYVQVEKLSQPLCGRLRPGHFRGVATVVLRLFTVTRCRYAAFGLKDYQQAVIIRQMTRDLFLNVELLFGKTLREPDGLAKSSRNAYLSVPERHIAARLPFALEWARSAALAGEDKTHNLRLGVEKLIVGNGEATIQYVDIVDPYTLEPLEAVGPKAVLALAVFVGKTRLIDNIMIGPQGESEPVVEMKV